MHQALNFVMIGHNLERIADLANNIAENTIYYKQGRDVGIIMKRLKKYFGFIPPFKKSRRHFLPKLISGIKNPSCLNIRAFSGG